MVLGSQDQLVCPESQDDIESEESPHSLGLEEVLGIHEASYPLVVVEVSLEDLGFVGVIVRQGVLGLAPWYHLEVQLHEFSESLGNSMSSANLVVFDLAASLREVQEVPFVSEEPSYWVLTRLDLLGGQEVP